MAVTRHRTSRYRFGPPPPRSDGSGSLRASPPPDLSLSLRSSASAVALLHPLGYLPLSMRIAEFLSEAAVVPALTAKTKPDVLAELAHMLANNTPQVSYERFHQVLDEREKIGSTGMEKGVAIPHGRLAELSSLVACFGVSREGVAFDARDGKPSHFFFALVAPENSAGLHLKALSKLSRLFRNDGFKDGLLVAQTSAELYALILQEDQKA